MSWVIGSDDDDRSDEKKTIPVDLGREEDVRGEEEGGGWQE